MPIWLPKIMNLGKEIYVGLIFVSQVCKRVVGPILHKIFKIYKKNENDNLKALYESF